MKKSEGNHRFLSPERQLELRREHLKVLNSGNIFRSCDKIDCPHCGGTGEVYNSLVMECLITEDPIQLSLIEKLKK